HGERSLRQLRLLQAADQQPVERRWLTSAHRRGSCSTARSNRCSPTSMAWHVLSQNPCRTGRPPTPARFPGGSHDEDSRTLLTRWPATTSSAEASAGNKTEAACSLSPAAETSKASC